MIIVGQDRTEIFNFDTIKHIWIEKDDYLSDDKEIQFEICADGETLGFYTTEKRAKEVLEEIVRKYSSYLQLNGGPAILQGQIDIQPNIFNIPKVYKMPEK